LSGDYRHATVPLVAFLPGALLRWKIAA